MAVQFLPASDSKKLEKRKGLGKLTIVLSAVAFAFILSLIIGLLLWHYHLRGEANIKKIYAGSMRLTNQAFVNGYENPNSTEFKDLASQVVSQLNEIYYKEPKLRKNYISSTVQAFSEGSVIAYYLSEFHVPEKDQVEVDRIISSIDKLQGRTGSSSRLLIDAINYSGNTEKSTRYAQHLQPNVASVIESPGFPNYPYPSNTMVQWELRADPGYIIKLEFESFSLEENCKNDFVKVYDSLVAIESRVICGVFSDHLTFHSSGNVMLVTLVTNDVMNFPGFRARATQVPLSTTTCGGILTGNSGTFTSPKYPDFYPQLTQCEWTIRVPQGKFVKVVFDKFRMVEPGQSNSVCQKDYVEIGTRKMCGTSSNLMEASQSNEMTVKFISDSSYVDRGFSATYTAYEPSDPCPLMFLCANKRCIKPVQKCDGWNDCGDSSDEKNCQCGATQVSCKNGFCKPMFWKCDGINDCGDNTDEENCVCKPDEFTCANDHCVSMKMRCDGQNDCDDGSDEATCGKDVPCTDKTYKCKNNKCVNSLNPECDGVKDCSDGSDEQNCGMVPHSAGRIVGGQDAVDGEWPWQVSLQVRGSHVCGASIISDSWIVTAAHCVQDDTKTRYSQPQTWEAYFGLHTQKDKSKAEKRNLKQVIAHPSYNTYTFDYDMALMELDRPLTFGNKIRPICLPSPSYSFPAGKSVWITGWGATKEGGFAATVLQKAEVRLINETVCNNLMNGLLTSRMMCAGVLTGGVDACQGDSGGPLNSLNAPGGHTFLAGVVSWGDGCARRNKPGIYTTVSKFRGWIKERTGV
uniref:Suppressor of tumorigenicity 14 protein homolog n=1 Tax=Denticeps clupeoides TaxID=299321 RepID=A0AAY4DDE3_9TELE